MRSRIQLQRKILLFNQILPQGSPNVRELILKTLALNLGSLSRNLNLGNFHENFLKIFQRRRLLKIDHIS